LAEASSGEITNCLPFPYDEFNGPLRLAYLSLIRRSLKVTDSGDWELLAAKTKLSGGKVPFSADAWHNLQLAFFENKISVVIDGAQVVRIEDNSFDHGNFGIGSGWHGAQFASIAIR